MERPQIKRKFNLKIFSVIICLCSILAALVGLSIDWSKPSWIFISGSSTLQPLLERISNIYKKAEISAIAGGSSLGISGILNNKKNIGMVSKSPSIEVAGLPAIPSMDKPAIPSTDKGVSSEKWQVNGIKTVTISYDTIAIIYKSQHDVILNNDNIAYLYLAFAGYVELNFAKLLNDNSIVNNQKIVPFGRTGGSIASGTAETFLSNNNIGINGSKEYLKNLNVNTTQIENSKIGNVNQNNVWDALQNGKYGKYTKQTNESSLEAWESIKGYNHGDVPITYLNGSFVRNNLDEITKNGFKIAKYQTIDGDLLIGNQLNHNYKWFKPLNLLLRTKNTNDQHSKRFVEWILGNSFFKKSSLYSTFKDLSFDVLEPKFIKTMFLDKSNIIDDITQYSNNNPDANYDDYLNDQSTNKDWTGFWKSDYELYVSQSTERDNLKEYYGAIFS